MSEEIKVKNKPGPKPKLGSSEPKKDAPAPRQRVSMHGDEKQQIPAWAKDPNFHFRWCADYGKGKIERYKGALWEFVLDDNGDRVKRPGGEPLYAMKLPKHLWEQDQLAKRGKITDINKQLQQDNRPSKNSAVPEYLPQGADSVLDRDNLQLTSALTSSGLKPLHRQLEDCLGQEKRKVDNDYRQ